MDADVFAGPARRSSALFVTMRDTWGMRIALAFRVPIAEFTLVIRFARGATLVVCGMRIFTKNRWQQDSDVRLHLAI